MMAFYKRLRSALRQRTLRMRAKRSRTPFAEPLEGRSLLTTGGTILKTVTSQAMFNLVDNTMQGGQQAFPPNQVYFAIIGLNASGQFSHVDLAGNLIPMQLSDNNAPNHLTQNGVNYSNYFFTASQIPAGGIPLPFMSSGNIYIGLGSPLYFQVNINIHNQIGYTAPNLDNPSDPNQHIYFSPIEFTYTPPNQVTGAPAKLTADTTEVDQFSFPMTLTMNSATNGSQTVGITAPRHTIFANFGKKHPAFRSLVDTWATPGGPINLRILAPKHATNSPLFQQNYYTPYINKVWTYYSSPKHALKLTVADGAGVNHTYTGSVSNNVFDFKSPGRPDLTFAKPTTAMVFGSNGVFKQGGTSQMNIGKILDAGFNRYVMLVPQFFANPSHYYQGPASNFYAAYWHGVSINHLAYGFDFDDVYNQSSTIALPSPTSMTVTVTWN